ncbi:RHS repeat domain-containing protein [Ostreibacterium oceani]|uniref:RHS repeat domain-containing protein n=1 Tax=Ostreibacterium oceani TaxID=2654998 RepID=UPI002E26C2F7
MNLYQNYHRDYNPNLGRYMQTDPIGLAGGINTYGYAGQSPLVFVDVYGLEPSCQALENAGLGHWCEPKPKPKPKPDPEACEKCKKACIEMDSSHCDRNRPHRVRRPVLGEQWVCETAHGLNIKACLKVCEGTDFCAEPCENS